MKINVIISLLEITRSFEQNVRNACTEVMIREPNITSIRLEFFKQILEGLLRSAYDHEYLHNAVVILVQSGIPKERAVWIAGQAAMSVGEEILNITQEVHIGHSSNTQYCMISEFDLQVIKGD
jgi:hypothetical protein